MADTNVQGGLCEIFVGYHEWLFPVEADELPGDVCDLSVVREKVPGVPAAPVSEKSSTDSYTPQSSGPPAGSPVRPRSSVLPTATRSSLTQPPRPFSNASGGDDMYSSDDDEDDDEAARASGVDTDALVAGIMAEPEGPPARPALPDKPVLADEPSLAAKPPVPAPPSNKPVSRQQSTGFRPPSSPGPAPPTTPKPALSRPASSAEDDTTPAVPKRTRSRVQSSAVRFESGRWECKGWVTCVFVWSLQHPHTSALRAILQTRESKPEESNK